MNIYNKITHFKIVTVFMLGAFLTACASKPYDYTAFKESRPASILVLPPVNKTPDVLASNSVYSYVTEPLAEAGYYVMPVTLVAEAFKENGITEPNDMHEVPQDKLREIFGADAALYINVVEYGTVYRVIMSDTIVKARAKLVDLRTGQLLWKGSAQASSTEDSDQQGQGLPEILIAALIEQVVATSADAAHPIAGIATSRLLTPSKPKGMLYGPRSPKYGKD